MSNNCFLKSKAICNCRFIKIIKLFFIILFLWSLGSCATLSEKAKTQNIKIATSQYMIQGMQNVFAYTTETSASIDEAGIVAANNAADNGWNNITVLVQYLGTAGGYFVNNVYITKKIYEISYWK
jgi:hypothetical protein